MACPGSHSRNLAKQSDIDSRLKLLARPWESDQGFRWTKAFGSQPHPTKKYLLHACTLCIPILCEQLEAGTRRVLLTVGSSEDLSGVVGTQFFTGQDHFHILYKSQLLPALVQASSPSLACSLSTTTCRERVWPLRTCTP